MGKYPQNIGTLTNGSLMYSLNLPSSYYFIWLFYKLPILIIIGYCLFPLVENKIFKDDVENEKSRKYILKAAFRENGQRNFISTGLNDAHDEDLILVSDVDEIPNLE